MGPVQLIVRPRYCASKAARSGRPGSGQVRSLLSLLSYFGKGENRERYLGVKIPRAFSSQTTSSRLEPSRSGWRIGCSTRLRVQRSQNA
jgi:hypothetical protein